MKKIFVFAIILCLAALAVGLSACGKAKVAKIEVDNTPKKTSYYIGEQLDVSGCTINVLYSDNSVRTVEVTDDMVSALDATAVGAKTVIITYTEDGRSYTTPLTLHVASRPPSSMRILTMPTKSEYIEGETIDLTGLTVEVSYTDTQKITVSAYDLSYRKVTATLDTESVSVGFGSLTLEVPVRVVPVAVTGIEATVIGDHIYRNQTLARNLFEVQYVYNNGNRLPTGEDATLQEEGERVEDVGPLTLHFVLGEYRCSLDVEAAEDVVRSVALVDAPLCYAVGDVFNWRDVVLSVDFAHTAGVRYTMGRDTYAGLTLTIADCTVFDHSGVMQIDVVSEGRTYASFYVGVDVVAPVRWRVASGANEVTDVEVGEVPKPLNLMLYAVLSDGTERLVWHRWRAEEGETVTLSEPAVAGQTTATLYYEGLSYDFAINVVQ